ncbi:MAG: tripartite tricarboxylate transporter TctB family protein [Bacteroidetes bacterium]|nr:tripartite tricarboxylate transporter TctB family protein [Bacteroidota bacterium]
MKNIIVVIIFILYLGLLGYLYLGIGQGTTYPAKPISIIVHSKPGSAIDYMARKVAEIARKYSDEAFVVENRSGTQGLVAMQHVLDLKADGYTMLGVTKSFLSTVMVNKSKVSLDDFRFIANMVSDPEALISNSERNFTSLDDIIQDANREEQQVWIGPGTGSRDHLMALKSWETLGIDAQWIDYKSAPQSILAMLRDESAVYVGNPADIKGKSNLDIISIASSKRLVSLPDVPTFKEQGYDLNESMWRGFAFKKGVPEEAVAYVTRVLQDVVNDEEWESYCNETYVFSIFEKNDEFTSRIAQEVEETNHYLDQAGLLVAYQKESPLHILIVLLIIVIAVLLLLLAFNKFSFSRISYDQIIAGSIIIVSLFLYYQTILFQIPETVNITNPALIPRIWIIILLLLSTLLIIKSKNKVAVKANHSSKIVLIIIALLILYLLAMQWAGYYFTTPLFILATMYLLKYRKMAVMGINALGFVLFSYFIFSKLLHIELPLGWWFI